MLNQLPSAATQQAALKLAQDLIAEAKKLLVVIDEGKKAVAADKQAAQQAAATVSANEAGINVVLGIAGAIQAVGAIADTLEAVEDVATIRDEAVSASASVASDKADAQVSGALAKKWANESENTVVVDGEYSAKHWAKKSEAVASQVAVSRRTRDLAAADNPDVSPEFYDVPFRDGSYAPASDAVYRKSETNPGHAGSFLNGAGVPYVNTSPSLKPRSISSNDDTAILSALQIADGRTIDLGTQRFTLTSQKSFAALKQLIVRGDDANIDFDFASHAERGLVISGAKYLIDIEGVTFDGHQKTNCVFAIENNSADMSAANLGNVRLAVTAKNARRNPAFQLGNNILVRGGFRTVDLSGCQSETALLPVGAGTPGSIGIGGILVTHFGLTGYVRALRMYGGYVADTRSEDLAYNSDQDGLAFFAPHVDSLGAYIPSSLDVRGVVFKNNYGRSIKTQCYDANVERCFFERDAGHNTPVNPEIGLQIAGGNVEGCSFYYHGSVPSAAINLASNSGGGMDYGRQKSRARDNTARVKTGTLPIFVSTFPSGGFLGSVEVTGNRVEGKVEHLVDYRINGSSNRLECHNNEVDEIAASTVVNVVGERAALLVSASGGTTPYRAEVHATGNVEHSGNAPALVRDNVVNVAAFADVSAFHNAGFANDATKRANLSGLKTDQTARLGRIGPKMDPVNDANLSCGHFEVKTFLVAAGASVTFPCRANPGTTNLKLAIRDFTAAGRVSIDVNTTVAALYGTAGSQWAVGASADPGTGNFRVWRSADNQITISNTTGTGRFVTVFEFAP